VILKMLPDNPAKAAWLTTEEKAWLEGQLKAGWRESAPGAQRWSDASAA